MISAKPFLLGKIVDTPLWVHPVGVAFCCFLAIPCAIRDPLAAPMLLVVLLASILAHEVGHALAARSAGLRVHEIYHLGFAGVCIYEDPGRRAKTRCFVAAAGPLANLLIAVTLLPLALILSDSRHSTSIVGAAVTMNFALCVGNLLPVFPLDGGQILFALVWERWSERTVSIIMVAIGILFAIPAALGCIALIAAGFPVALPASLGWRGTRIGREARQGSDRDGPCEPNDGSSSCTEADRLMSYILAEQSRRNAERRRTARDASA